MIILVSLFSEFHMQFFITECLPSSEISSAAKVDFCILMIFFSHINHSYYYPKSFNFINLNFFNPLHYYICNLRLQRTFLRQLNNFLLIAFENSTTQSSFYFCPLFNQFWSLFSFIISTKFIKILHCIFNGQHYLHSRQWVLIRIIICFFSKYQSKFELIPNN